MRFEFLSKHFPIPRFLKPSHIGISFSDSAIKAISFNGNHHDPKIKSVVIPLEKGIIVDGKIVEQKELVKKILLIRDTMDFSFVTFTIPDELAFIFQVFVPVGKGGNASESIAFTIEENVPLALSDTVFDFKPVNISKSESEFKSEVVVAACVKTEVEKFSGALRSGGFDPVGCIHESQAIASAILSKESKGISCIVHARKERIGIYLIKDNLVYFSTIRNITEGDYKKQFTDEYEKFVEYSARYGTENNLVIKSMLVCGEFEFAKKIVEAVIDGENKLKEAKLANVWSNLFKIENYTPTISFEDSLSLAGPIGAILSDIV